MAQPKVYAYTVGGTLTFPLDMLRYDNCWPAMGVDVDALGNALARYAERTHKGPLTVRMLSHKVPTVARWESFGWSVSDVTVNGERLNTLRFADGSVHLW